MSEHYGYIYITENLINHKKYIGKHAKPEFDKSYKGSGKFLILAFDKYGWDNFKTEILEWCDSLSELNSRERYWIAYYGAVESEEYYNKSEGGDGNSSESVLNGKNPRAIPVRCVELDKVFGSIKEAAEFIDRGKSRIYDSIYHGSRAGGYHWEYVDGSRSGQLSASNGRYSNNFASSSFRKGSHHTDETKKRMSLIKTGIPVEENRIQVVNLKTGERYESVTAAKGCGCKYPIQYFIEHPKTRYRGEFYVNVKEYNLYGRDYWVGILNDLEDTKMKAENDKRIREEQYEECRKKRVEKMLKDRSDRMKILNKTIDRSMENNPMYGKSQSISTKEKIGRANKGRGLREVVNIDTHIVYKSVTDASISVDRSVGNLINAIREGRKCGGYMFQYLDMIPLDERRNIKNE